MGSFGASSLAKRRSFPRKRESSPWAGHFQRLAGWIPAFAGMTTAWNPCLANDTTTRQVVVVAQCLPNEDGWKAEHDGATVSC